MNYQRKINLLAQRIKDGKRVFALTGAGISTASGIPDYRSPGTGLWEKINPEKSASVTALRQNPEYFYRQNLLRWAQLESANPNEGHIALAKLEEKGYLMGVITQNIDGLHQKAGSKKVWELHGEVRTCRCSQCQEQYQFGMLVDQFQRGVIPPVCPSCQGMLRPNVVLFEDPMPEAFYQASQVLTGCDFLLVVGTSLQVYPAASLPQKARRIGIVNLMETPYDSMADVVIRENAGQVLSDLVTALP